MKTAKAKPTANTGTKTKKSTSQKTVRGKSNTNELPSSPRSRADRVAHRGALLNLTDVDDPALSDVNPSVSEINYDVVSPGAARAQDNAIEDDNVVGKGMDVAYNSDDSDDEDYRGDVYDDDYSDGEDLLAKYRVSSARGKGQYPQGVSVGSNFSILTRPINPSSKLKKYSTVPFYCNTVHLYCKC